jgi:PTH1 family peptidyl-tRNA hydrolase
MQIVVGLGNPGAEYAGHRHNIGFMAVDEIVRRHGLPPFRSRFSGAVSEGVLGGEKVLLLKPQTYMNRSGQSVGEALRFYKLAPDDITVIYDEIDLTPGKVRVRTGGGHGGHNGIRDIDAHIGNGFRRVRLGIGHPGDKALVTPHVLGNFAKAEREGWVAVLLEALADALPLLLAGDESSFMNRISVALQRAGVSGEDRDKEGD